MVLHRLFDRLLNEFDREVSSTFRVYSVTIMYILLAIIVEHTKDFGWYQGWVAAFFNLFVHHVRFFKPKSVWVQVKSSMVACVG